MSELARAKRTRTAHRSSLTKTIHRVEEELQEPTDNSEHKLRQFKQSLKQKLLTLDVIDEVILEQVGEDELEDEVDQIDAIKERVGLCVLALEDALTPKVSDSSTTEGTTSSADDTGSAKTPNRIDTSAARIATPAEASRVKLPKLTIPTFDGNIVNWMPFWDQFESTIHDNHHLKDVDKFKYLISYLQGEAKEAIAGIAVTSANYKKALTRLEERFGDVQPIVDGHMQALLHLPVVNSTKDLRGLRKLVDTVHKNVDALDALGKTEDYYAGAVTSVIMESLPSDIALSLRKELGSDLKNATSLISALSKDVMEREKTTRKIQARNRSPSPPQHQPTAATFLAGANSQCPFCGKDHAPQACQTITSPAARADIMRKQGRCFNCLRKGHLGKHCRSRDRCKKCGGKHHVTLCRGGGAGDRPDNRKNQGGGARGSHNNQQTPGREATTREQDMPTNALLAGSDSQVLLQTAKMKIFNPAGNSSNTREVRALMDTGSQRTYISEKVAKQLKLTYKDTKVMKIQTFGEDGTKTTTCHLVDLAVKTLHGEPLLLEAMAVPTIGEPLTRHSTLEAKWKHPHLKNLKLSDPTRMEDTLHIDLLIGADSYWNLVTGSIRKGKSGPTAIQTRAGWVLSGPTEVQEDTSTSKLLFTTTHLLRIQATPEEEDNLDSRLKRFWDLETLGVQEQEESVQEKFVQTIQHLGDRYEVRLPWRPTHRPLPTNLQLCRNRLQSLLKKLKATPTLLAEYNAIIQDQLDKGIVEPVPDQQTSTPPRIHYLPHHPVIRRDKSTTKVRVVFDASAKSYNNPSLNDCLYAGPSFDQSIFDILLRFRRHKIAMAADIEKAFLMVAMNQEDRDALRFLWIEDTQQNPPAIRSLRFTRVTFGVSSSPFLLNATIRHHISQYQHQDPEFVTTFLQSIYVDDVSFGAETEQQAYQLFAKAKTRLGEAGFNLRKFTTNSTSLQNQVDSQEEASTATPATSEDDTSFAKTSLGVKGEESEGRGEEQKILGVRWRKGEDSLIFSMGEMAEDLQSKTPTKREVVGAAARIFDPLGVVSPSTVLWKMLFQDLCKAGVSWDEPLREEHLVEWTRLTTAMRKKVEVILPRCYNVNKKEKARLIGFCDASEKAYAAVVYLRLGEKKARVHFLAAKTRVAPTKRMTIPRLELMSALLLAKLCSSIEKALENSLDLEDTLCFTDSKVSLHWIVGQDREWKTFVDNRVNTIRKLIPPNCWSHCPGKENPADLPSRGKLPEELSQSTIWLQGPDWLRHQLQPNQGEGMEIPPECLQEEKKGKTLTFVTIPQEKKGVGQLLNPAKFSDIKRLLRITGHVIRFIQLSRRRATELLECQKQAEILWLKETQEELLSNPKFGAWKTQLGLVQDENLLWRCMGRMTNAELSPEAKKPILIGRKHPFSHLLAREAHLRVLHGGVKATLNELRSHYWIMKGRQTIKKLVKNCPTCRKYEGAPFKSLTAPALPAFRVQARRPFSAVGVDFAGPLYVKGSASPKTWICLFSCCSSRAVHLELLPDLTVSTFLGGLRRFCARRGVPDRILSDSAQTFKAADKSLQSLLQNPEVKARAENMRIHWTYNVEKAPWQGGFFERMVKSTKRCLRKTLGKNTLSFDELMTLVVEVEGVLNSRPLSYISEDDQEEPLTPAHLITGHRLLSLPDPITSAESDDEEDFTPTPEKLTRRMKHLAIAKDRFWQRWREEYLKELREFHRTLKTSKGVERPVTEGEAVVLFDESQPRGMWKLGRIDRLLHSTDGEVRAAAVKVHSKTGRPTILNRPIQHLYPLEVRDSPITESTQLETKDRDEQAPEELPTSDGKNTSRPTRAAAERARGKIQELSEQSLI